MCFSATSQAYEIMQILLIARNDVTWKFNQKCFPPANKAQFKAFYTFFRSLSFPKVTFAVSDRGTLTGKITYIKQMKFKI